MSLYSQATIIVTNSDSNQKEIITDWLKINDSGWLLKNSSYLNEEATSISIDEIRILKRELTYGVDISQKRYIIVLHANLLTLAAQNACLKLLEEPPAHTYIILVTNSVNHLLKTIQSRCATITLETKIEEHFQLEQTLYETIQRSTYGELIGLSEKYSQKAEALTELASMIRYLHSALATSPSKALEYGNSITACLKCISDLEKNYNMKLAVGECFFSLKNSLNHK